MSKETPTSQLASTRQRAMPPESGLRELMLLPVMMGGLSLLLWFSLPTGQQVLDRYAIQIEQRKRQVAQAVSDLPRDGCATDTRCIRKLDPMPMRIGDDAFATNTEFITASDLANLGIDSPLRADKEEFHLRGRLGLLMYWHRQPLIGYTQRMGQDRIKKEFLDPLDTRYLVLYGIKELDATGATRVDVFLYNFATGERMCELLLVMPVYEWKHSKSRFLIELATLTGGVFSDKLP
jgi:hypothetical protein